MRILVDADACPVKEIVVNIARKYGVSVVMICDTSHEISDGYSSVVVVDKASDSADYALMKLISKDDIVVTQDYGLAAMVLGKGAKVLNQNGFVYTDDNIDRLLMERHIGQKVRRGGGRTKGPAKRTKENDESFAAIFEKLIK